MYIIADMTRADVGSISSVLERLPKNDGSVYALELVIQPKQRAELANKPHLKITEIAENSDIGAQVCQALALRVAELPAEQFAILSFNSYVLGSSHKLNVADQDRVQFVPWGQARTLRDAAGNLAPTGWPLSTIPIEEAVRVLMAVLGDAKAYDKATAVRQTSLRPKLSDKDARLSSAQTAHVKNLISKLVGRSANDGLVGVDDSDHKNPKIWIAAGTPQAKEQQKASATRQQQRGQLYIKTLKDGKMGPFPNFRDEVFSALDQMVAVEEKPSLQDLVGNAISTVKANCNGAHSGFPWSSVKDFLIELLRLHPVVLDVNGQAFRPGFSTWKTKVVSLDDGWRLKLDGELVLYLLRKGCEITFYDISELTGALYKTREDTYTNRLHDVIGLLKDAGKIQFDDQDSLITLAAS